MFPEDRIRTVRSDYLIAETQRDFPRLSQVRSTYLKVRSGQGPLFLSSEMDSVAPVMARRVTKTWAIRFGTLLLAMDCWEEILYKNWLKVTPAFLAVHRAALSSLSRYYPRPMSFLASLSLYRNAVRGWMGEAFLERPTSLDSSSPFPHTRMRCQLSFSLRPAAYERSSSSIHWFVLHGYEILEAKILASMVADIRTLSRYLPEVQTVLPSSPITEVPSDPEMETSSVVGMRDLLRAHSVEVPEGQQKRKEYFPTALLFYGLTRKLDSAYSKIEETGALKAIRFCLPARSDPSKARLSSNHPTVCNRKITRKLEGSTDYLGFRWKHFNGGVTHTLALNGHACYVNGLVSVYGDEAVAGWYQYLYISRGLLLREDSTLDTRAHLLEFFLEYVGPEVRRNLAVFPPPVVRRGHLLRKDIHLFLEAAKKHPKIGVFRKAVEVNLPGWRLEPRMRIVKGLIEKSIRFSDVDGLLARAKNEAPEAVLTPYHRTLGLRVQGESGELTGS